MKNSDLVGLLRPAAVILALLTVLTGIAYPLAVTAAAQGLFGERANGSLVEVNGQVVGSSLIGQPFDDAHYFWGRPSATGSVPCNGGASTGSNLGPSNSALHEAVAARVLALRAAHPERGDAPVPVDLVTTSASGLDPDVSPAAALYQAGRVAAARGLNEAQVITLVDEHTVTRTFGVLGEPRVNVLRLNLALDALAPSRP
jgi:K+-transporting ATPase ATPase C chain